MIIIADRFWVGDSGFWHDTNHWSATSGGASGAVLPTSADNVYFDVNSFSSPSCYVSLTNLSYCLNMDWTGALYIPQFRANGNSLFIYGSLTLIAQMYTLDPIFSFRSTSSGNTITTGGQSISELQFYGVAGDWTLQDDINGRPTISLYKGTFYTNDKTITSRFLTCPDGSARELNLGASIITLDGTSNNIGTTCVLDAGTSTIILTGYSNKFYAGNHTFNNIEFLNNGILYGTNTFSDFTIGAGVSLSVEYGTIQTVNNLIATGTVSNQIVIKSTYFGAKFTISKASSVCNVYYCSITDSIASGGATFNANNSINIAGNSGWNFFTDDVTLHDSIYRGNALHVFDVDKNTWFAWKENITSIQEGYDETIFIREIDGFNYEQSETYYTRDRDLTDGGVYVDIPWEFITKSYMGGISQKETLTDISLHYKCSTNATVNVGYSEQSTNLLSTSFHSLAATSDFIIDNKDHIQRILIPTTALQNVDYYNLRFNGTGKFTLYGMEQNFRVKKR